MTATRTLLYIEDDENDVFFMERAFRVAGVRHTLRVAPNGQAALALLAAVPPDLLVLDLKVPVLDGFDVLRRLRDPASPHRSLPAVVLSSSSHASDIRRCCELGANGYVVKPANAELLTTLVRVLCTTFLDVDRPPQGWATFPGNTRVPAAAAS